MKPVEYASARRDDLHFREFVENVTDVIYWVDVDSRFTFVNGAGLRAMRCRERDVLGLPLVCRVEPAHRATVAAFYERQGRERRTHSYLEFPLTAGPGESVWLAQTVRTVFDDAGMIVGFQALAHDITARKNAERDRERLINELQMALVGMKAAQGVVPICTGCKKVDAGTNSWQPVEAYFHDHNGTEFSPGLCPGCLERYFVEVPPAS